MYISQALKPQYPLPKIVNRLNILLQVNRFFVAPSAVIQAKQRLGLAVVKRVFEQISQPEHSTTMGRADLANRRWCHLANIELEFR